MAAGDWLHAFLTRIDAAEAAAAPRCCLCSLLADGADSLLLHLVVVAQLHARLAASRQYATTAARVYLPCVIRADSNSSAAAVARHLGRACAAFPDYPRLIACPAGGGGLFDTVARVCARITAKPDSDNFYDEEAEDAESEPSAQQWDFDAAALLGGTAAAAAVELVPLTVLVSAVVNPASDTTAVETCEVSELAAAVLGCEYDWEDSEPSSCDSAVDADAAEVAPPAAQSQADAEVASPAQAQPQTDAAAPASPPPPHPPHTPRHHHVPLPGVAHASARKVESIKSALAL
eukprot:TRINITY_DN9213_c0_g1_i2.p1 TRINITY_DN9213_c0_g1~~TRINITY_DN9213_c0_g1_i2.p1  ORF type:complete len:291 (-),score=89.02 TRINITY_DN9213_c0_g1_i2:75-947(-)